MGGIEGEGSAVGRVDGEQSGMPSDRHDALWRLALGAWVVFIWAHSLLPGDTSSSESGFFLMLLRPVFESFGMHDVDAMHFLLRKIAHFSEYAVLGLISFRAIRPRWRGTAGRLAAFCCLWVGVPCIDEAIQAFTPDRGPAVRDVLIDMSGFAVGALVMTLVLGAWRRRRQGG